MVTSSSPFGGQTRTRMLLALRLLEESYARELARLLAVPINGIQSAVRGAATRPSRPRPALRAAKFTAVLTGQRRRPTSR